MLLGMKNVSSYIIMCGLCRGMECGREKGVFKMESGGWSDAGRELLSGEPSAMQIVPNLRQSDAKKAKLRQK